MPRKKKKKDIANIIAAARKLRADIDSVASDMKGVAESAVLSIIKGIKRRGRPPKPKRGRPPKARKARLPKRKRGRPRKAKKAKLAAA